MQKPLHESTFHYLKPTATQSANMSAARHAADTYARSIETLVPDGADKTYILRKIREIAMWANAAITREADGTPRDGAQVGP